MPPYLRKNIPKSEYDLALQLPIIPAGDGILLVNEYFPEWETVRDLLIALDTFPRDLLQEIYKAEKKPIQTQKRQLFQRAIRPVKKPERLFSCFAQSF